MARDGNLMPAQNTVGTESNAGLMMFTTHTFTGQSAARSQWAHVSSLCGQKVRAYPNREAIRGPAP